MRSRVAATTFEKVNDNDPNTYNHASFFTYDIHGNVNRYVQEIPALTFLDKNIYTIDYDFDLLTNKVLEVSYQKDKPDQYFHRYDYDKDQKLKAVETSTDHVIWEQDARYFYYLHGPLGRTELGNLQVQGIDYAYTLNGSLKAVNGAIMDASKDMGKDGSPDSWQIYKTLYGYLTLTSVPNPNQYVAKDAFAFNLRYYKDIINNTDDYTAVNGEKLQADISNSDISMNGMFASLYNGNIAMMSTSLPTSVGISNQTMINSTQGNVYRYDLLNRLRHHFVFTNLNQTNMTWQQTGQMGNTQHYEDFNYDANGNILNLNRNGQKTGTQLPMDNLAYQFEYETIGLPYTYNGSTQTITWDRLVHNKLKHVTDQVTAPNYSNDVKTQSILNYAYDKLGNLIKDNAEEIATIKWNVSGKVEEIIRNTGSTKPDLEFGYNTQGTRMYKIVKPKNSGGGLMYQHAWKITYYVRDLQGSVMATYTQTYSKFTPNGVSTHLNSHYVLNDHHIYGSNRVGVQRSGKQQTKRELLVTYFTSGEYQFNTQDAQNNVNYTATLNTSRAILYRGCKTYELTNHLGNVLATIQDRKLNKNDNTGPVFTTQYYIPFVNSVTDYYAFGSEMGGRSFTIQDYRYGFQNQEKDDEIKGKGNSVNYKYRMHDARLGRFFAVDPLAGKYPWNSTYAFSENDVIGAVELEGLEKVTLNERQVQGVTVGINYIIEHDPTNTPGGIATTNQTSVSTNNQGFAISISDNKAKVNTTTNISGISGNALSANNVFIARGTNININPPEGSQAIKSSVGLPNQFNQGTLYTNAGTLPGAGVLARNYSGRIANSINNGGTVGSNSVIGNNTTSMLIVTNGSATAIAMATRIIGTPAVPATGTTPALPATGLIAQFPHVQFATIVDLNSALNNDQMGGIHNITADYFGVGSPANRLNMNFGGALINWTSTSNIVQPLNTSPALNSIIGRTFDRPNSRINPTQPRISRLGVNEKKARIKQFENAN